MGSDRAARVAIIGGGCAAITTAFELSRPSLGGRFDITVYQLGWRLGGKGASGRGPSGRIEEHGLHVWMGFYDNAFRLMRECYAELAEDPAGFDIGDWREAFIPENDIGVWARSEAEDWHSWSACFPPQAGLPGDPITKAHLLSLPRYLGRAVSMLGTLIRTVDSRSGGARQDDLSDEEPETEAAPALGDPRRILTEIERILGGAAAASTAVLIEALAVLEAGLKMLPPALSSPLASLAEWIAHNLRRWFERTLIAEPYFQHVWEVMDIVVATVVGILRFGLLTDPRGLDAIDDYECREWLRLNGASERSLQSPYIRGLYDLALSYEDGDARRPAVAAGQALRASLRMFWGYRGAVFWRMRAGMGDVVFAPLYEALRRRGVKFEFFHRLTDIVLADEADLAPGERPYVTRLDFDVQAKTRDGGAFSPLMEVNGRPCWPAKPDFTQLADGERMAAEGWDFECHWDRRKVATRTLKVVEDFDFVVLGIGVGALPHACPCLLARDARWRRMVQAVKTVGTQAFQIWLDRDLEALGGRGPPYLGSAFAKPFDTWCDMAHTIPEEAWTRRPASVLYFCGVLPDAASPEALDDPAYPRRRDQEVKRNALRFLGEQARGLWPDSCGANGEFRWEMLMDAAAPDPRPGDTPSDASRFDTQYWRANVNPSDRYVLALPGSLKHRISPLDMTYDNLTIAGDWTDCGFNEGCVEAAVMSGRLAAHALACAPLLEDIVGYDHP
jgi:uncharacterized protein with NAD-binding domain and iron-sulfur cluster